MLVPFSQVFICPFDVDVNLCSCLQLCLHGKIQGLLYMSTLLCVLFHTWSAKEP